MLVNNLKSRLLIKVASIIVILSILMTNSLPLFAYSQDLLSVMSASGFRGGKASVRISLQQKSDIAGLQFILKYDKNNLSIKEEDIKLDSKLTAWVFSINVLDDVGEIRFSCANSSVLQISGNVIVCSANFTIKDQAKLGETPITLESVLAGDGYNKADIGSLNGSVSISENPVIPFIFGDISGDGHFDSGDVYLLKSYLLVRVTDFPNINWRKAADVSGDGNIDSSDYLLLRAKILKKITKFPVETN